MGVFGKIFGRKEEVLPPLDLSFLKTDMHSHLIPGIDDGSASMDDTIVMLAKFESLGYKKVVTTPHIMSDYFRNSPETILPALDEVRNVASKMNLNIEIEAAAEYYFDETLLNKLKNKEELLSFGDKHVLFEFSFHSKPSHTEELIFEFLTQGYQPVLAHFERYAWLEGSIDLAYQLRDKGVNIQMNFGSLGGHYGPMVQKQAEALVDNNLVDFAATDCHRIDHLMILEENLTRPYFHKLKELDLKNSTI
jgi:tyrosine-protein phosphatase YwqE